MKKFFEKIFTPKKTEAPKAEDANQGLEKIPNLNSAVERSLRLAVRARYEPTYENLKKLSQESYPYDEEGKEDLVLLKYALNQYENNVPNNETTFQDFAKNILDKTNLDSLPFRKENLGKHLGNGAVHQVFEYWVDQEHKGNPKYVVKMLGDNFFNEQQTAESIAKKYNQEYEKLLKIFSEEFIPQEFIIQAENPFSGKPTVITIQEYTEGEQFDLFPLDRDFSEEELIKLKKMLVEDADFSKSFSDFVTRMEKMLMSSSFPDHHGKDNIVINIDSSGKKRLVILDTHPVIIYDPYYDVADEMETIGKVRNLREIIDSVNKID
ncbi:MAG: hypothetical protein WC678_03870 [Parcubacteria group bacterium]|jgi:hypothetical protein